MLNGSVVSAALHELVKGMPDSPDLSLMAELFEVEFPECESPVVDNPLQHLHPRRPSTVSRVSQTASTQSPACQNSVVQISVESSETGSISVQPELVLPPIHRKKYARLYTLPRSFKIHV